MRVLTALNQEDPSKLEHASHEIWMQIWNRDLDITDDAVLTEALGKTGISVDQCAKLIQKTDDPSIKKALIDTTQEAIDAQAFGAPSFIIREDGKDDALFFGQGKF